ncbi:hypothetical protein EV401DRAFT_1916640, partial [Pisolithus croceorrhizus]
MWRSVACLWTGNVVAISQMFDEQWNPHEQPPEKINCHPALEEGESLEKATLWLSRDVFVCVLGPSSEPLACAEF